MLFKQNKVETKSNRVLLSPIEVGKMISNFARTNSLFVENASSPDLESCNFNNGEMSMNLVVYFQKNTDGGKASNMTLSVSLRNKEKNEEIEVSNCSALPKVQISEAQPDNEKVFADAKQALINKIRLGIVEHLKNQIEEDKGRKVTKLLINKKQKKLEAILGDKIVDKQAKPDVVEEVKQAAPKAPVMIVADTENLSKDEVAKLKQEIDTNQKELETLTIKNGELLAKKSEMLENIELAEQKLKELDATLTPQELESEIRINIRALLDNEEIKKLKPTLLDKDISLDSTKDGFVIKTKIKLDKVPYKTFLASINVSVEITMIMPLINSRDNKLSLGDIIIKTNRGEDGDKAATEKLSPYLDKIIPGIKVHFETKYKRKVASMKIERGNLYIEFETTQGETKKEKVLSDLEILKNEIVELDKKLTKSNVSRMLLIRLIDEAQKKMKELEGNKGVLPEALEVVEPVPTKSDFVQEGIEGDELTKAMANLKSSVDYELRGIVEKILATNQGVFYSIKAGERASDIYIDMCKGKNPYNFPIAEGALLKIMRNKENKVVITSNTIGSGPIREKLLTLILNKMIDELNKQEAEVNTAIEEPLIVSKTYPGTEGAPDRKKAILEAALAQIAILEGKMEVGARKIKEMEEETARLEEMLKKKRKEEKK